MKSKAVHFRHTLIFSYLIGYLYICCFLFGFGESRPLSDSDAWYQLLFTASFFLWGSYAFKDRKCSKEHWLWMACALTIAAAIACGRCEAVGDLNFFALHGFAAYWVICRAGMLTEDRTSEFLPYDVLQSVIIAPFGGIFLRLKTVFNAVRRAFSSMSGNSRKRRFNGRKAVICAIVIAAAIPLFAHSAGLLGKADADFTALLERISDCFFGFDTPAWIIDFVYKCIFALPVGAYLFGLVGGSMQRHKPRLDAKKVRADAEKLRAVPNTAFVIVFSGFALLYLLFFYVQGEHLLGAFYGNVPGKLTASDYARDGFFQLTKVMGINFVLLTAAAKLSTVPIRKHKPMMILSAVLMTESIFLAVTAASKLWLYIERFGFTPLRLLSAWWIAVLTVGSVLALISLRKNFGAVRKLTYFAAVSFTLLCLY